MKFNAQSDTRRITRRRFMHGISASGLLLVSPRAFKRETAPASLRKLAGGRPLMGTSVKTQFDKSHLELGDKAAVNLDKMIQQFAAEGFRCALTELDVDVIPRALHWNPKTRGDSTKQDPYANGCPDEILQRQAAVYREVMQAVMANVKHVDRVTVWGISDRHSWLNKWPWKCVNHGLLFDREAKPKPAFHAVATALRQE